MAIYLKVFLLSFVQGDCHQLRCQVPYATAISNVLTEKNKKMVTIFS